MDVSARVVDRPGGIQDPGQVYGFLNGAPMGLEIALGPSRGFVERRPGDDGRMVQIAQDRLTPFALRIVNSLRLPEIDAPVRELAPRQVAKAGCMAGENHLSPSDPES